jgi:flagellar biosynthesis/type III secretory pathway protein FliH
MGDDFRSFATLLLGNGKADDVPPAEPETGTAGEPAGSSPAAAGSAEPTEITDPRVLDLLDDFTVELTRLTARVAELLEERAEASLADLAQRVLGRELHASPAEISALLAQTVAEFAVTEPLVLRVSSADAERLRTKWPIVVDPTLTSGDFAIDVDDGTYDLKLQTRLDAMLAAHRISL